MDIGLENIQGLFQITDFSYLILSQ